LSDIFFRRGPNDRKPLPSPGGKGRQLEILSGNKGIRYVNQKPQDRTVISYSESLKTRNAVYCAIVLEEFVKELAALTQEHSILLREDEEL